MHTIITLTHIPLQFKLQALVQFEYKGKNELITVLVLVENVGTDLIEIYINQNFIDACNAAITARKNIIDNPFIF